MCVPERSNVYLDDAQFACLLNLPECSNLLQSIICMYYARWHQIIQEKSIQIG